MTGLVCTSLQRRVTTALAGCYTSINLCKPGHLLRSWTHLKFAIVTVSLPTTDSSVCYYNHSTSSHTYPGPHAGQYYHQSNKVWWTHGCKQLSQLRNSKCVLLPEINYKHTGPLHPFLRHS